MILGWNEDDGSLFVPTTNFTTESAVIAYVRTEWPGLTNKNITEILNLYPSSDFQSMVESPQFFRAARVFRDIKFTCPQIDFSYQVAKHGSEVYLYALNQTMFHEEELSLPSFFGGTKPLPPLFSLLQSNTSRSIHDPLLKTPLTKSSPPHLRHPLRLQRISSSIHQLDRRRHHPLPPNGRLLGRLRQHRRSQLRHRRIGPANLALGIR